MTVLYGNKVDIPVDRRRSSIINHSLSSNIMLNWKPLESITTSRNTLDQFGGKQMTPDQALTSERLIRRRAWRYNYKISTPRPPGMRLRLSYDHRAKSPLSEF